MINEMNETAERRKEEARLKEEVRQAAENAKNMSEGKIYGNDYHRYTKSDIKNISDVDFLRTMFFKVLPSGQPKTNWEYEEMCDIENCITARMNDLKK